MSFNLLEMVKDQVSGQLVEHATGILGESEGGISKALGGIFPSVLGSMISKGSEEGGASKLFDLVKGVDPGILGNMGSLLGGEAEGTGESSLMGMGSGLLSSLMGDKLGGAVDLVSKLGGIKSGSAMSLFKMAAPLLTGLFSKKVAEDGLDLSSFTSLLNDQKEAVSNALPAGMGSLMGMGSLLGSAKDLAGGALGAAMGAVGSTAGAAKNVAGNAASSAGNVVGKTANVASEAASAAATAAVTGAEKTGSAIWKYLIPALLIAAAAYFLTQSSMCKDTAIGDTIGETIEKGADMTKDAASATAELATDAGGAVLAGSKAAGSAVVDGAKTAGNAVVDGAKTAGNAVASALGTVNEAGKAALSKIKFTAGSAGSQMMDYINGNSKESTFRFKNLNFNSGSAVISGTSGSEVDNLAAILKAYPDVKVQIDGYTDSDGADDANMKLSQGRADAVGNRLGAQGIASSRVSTKGYGEANPVADNNTAAGKAENRRIEVKIVK